MVLFITLDHFLEDDIIHELLHVRFPDFSEDEVNFWTNLLIKRAGIDN